MKVNQDTTFTQIYAQLKPGLLSNEGKHIRGLGNDLYTHNALMAHGKGAQALADRPAEVWRRCTAIKDAIAGRVLTP